MQPCLVLLNEGVGGCDALFVHTDPLLVEVDLGLEVPGDLGVDFDEVLALGLDDLVESLDLVVELLVGGSVQDHGALGLGVHKLVMEFAYL